MLLRNTVIYIFIAAAFAALFCVGVAAEDELPNIERARELVSSRYLEDRRSGIEMFETLGKEAIPALLKLLEGDDYNSSACAAVVLGRLKHPRSLGYLHKLVATEADMYTALALPLLPDFEEDGYSPAVANLCASSDESTAASAAEALRELCSFNTVLERFLADIRPKLYSSNANERDIAVAATAAVGKKAVPLLTEALSEPYPVGYSALQAISSLGSDTFDELLETLRHGQLPPAARTRLARALFGIEHEGRFEAMMDLLQEEESSLVRAEVVSAATHLTEDRAAEVLSAAVNDRSAFVRARATETVSSYEALPDGFEADLLVSRLGDPADVVRMQAVSACAHFKLSAALPAMEMLFEDPDPNVAMNAMWTAGNYGDPVVLPLLARYANGPDERFHVPAAKSLLQLGSRSAETLLLKKLKEKTTREYAIYALSYAKSNRAVDRLVGLLGDLPSEQREMASFTLYKITGARLETGQWEKWWNSHRTFWNSDIREGVEYYFIGLELERDQLFHVASEAYAEALRLAPDFPPVAYRIALQHFRAGEFDKARVFAHKAALQMPTSAHHLLEARCLFALDRLDDALESVRSAKAASTVPDNELVELEKKILKKAAK